MAHVIGSRHNPNTRPLVPVPVQEGVLFVLAGRERAALYLRPKQYTPVSIQQILKTMKNNMKNKKNMRENRVIPRAMAPLANVEAAQCGEALLAQNLRERESALQVTGEPTATSAIAVDDRLLLLTGGHTVTSRGSTVKINGARVATVAGTITGAHAVGNLIVVVTDAGLTYLTLQGGNWNVLDPAAAVPQLSIGANTATSSAEVDAYAFDEPYSRWQAPLADVDRAALTARLRAAWSALSNDIHAEDRHLAPMLVRWAVRLVDGSYLWMSDPVRVGDMTLSNADRISAMVETNSNSFIGTEATRLTMTHYALDIAVTQDIAAEWLPLVSSIDVFATDEAQLLTSSPSLDYRCLTRTTGTREYILEMGLSRRSANAISRELAISPWHLVATAPASPQIVGSDFGAPAEALTLTNAQCADIGRLPALGNVVCSTTAGGRLYCCTRDGDVVASMPGNALAEDHRRRVTGAVPLAMAVVTRPLYSSGFGRYPVYVFTDDGIYAIPQSATGALGEARLVDRTLIAAGVLPVEGGGTVWLISRHGHLCRLDGSRLTLCHRDMPCTALAWCDAQSELWMLPATGYPVVMMASGRLTVRTVAASQLYSDPRHCVAVTDAGTVLDLECESPALVPVAWHSHPVAQHPLLGEAVHRVVWHLSGSEVDVTLKVVGQRGIMFQDSDVSVITVSGAVDQPLATPTMAVRARTVRLALDGMARSGTLLLPTLVYSL